MCFLVGFQYETTLRQHRLHCQQILKWVLGHVWEGWNSLCIKGYTLVVPWTRWHFSWALVYWTDQSSAMDVLSDPSFHYDGSLFFVVPNFSLDDLSTPEKIGTSTYMRAYFQNMTFLSELSFGPLVCKWEFSGWRVVQSWHFRSNSALMKLFNSGLTLSSQQKGPIHIIPHVGPRFVVDFSVFRQSKSRNHKKGGVYKQVRAGNMFIGVFFGMMRWGHCWSLELTESRAYKEDKDNLRNIFEGGPWENWGKVGSHERGSARNTDPCILEKCSDVGMWEWCLKNGFTTLWHAQNAS